MNAYATGLNAHFMYDAASGVVTGVYFGKRKLPEVTPEEQLARMCWEFGSSVQAKRKELGYKVKDLARWTEIHPETLRYIELGSEGRIGGTALRQGHWLVQRLAEYLNTTPKALWPWHDDKERDEAW